MNRLLADTRLELWCEALESGKYPHTTGKLCKVILGKGPCFCALGVALEIYWELHPNALEFEIKHEDDGSWPFRQYYHEDIRGHRNYFSHSLPGFVARWYGIREQGQLKRAFRIGPERLYIHNLDTLNDRGWTPRALAGIIKRGYLERTI